MVGGRFVSEAGEVEKDGGNGRGRRTDQSNPVERCRRRTSDRRRFVKGRYGGSSDPLGSRTLLLLRERLRCSLLGL